MSDTTHGFQHDARPLVRLLGKAPADWRRSDLVEFALEHGIRVLNFHYPSIDGKLKELRLPVRDRDYLERILAAGERVDGSSLFPGLFSSGASDLYVLPVYRWAFLNPFAEDELDIVCRFAGGDGQPEPSTPDNLLFGAAEKLRLDCGFELHALAELEFYLILERSDDRFTSRAQRNYHQSAPYLHSREIADEILRVLSEVTGAIKYCHSEVGYIDRIASDDPELDGRRVEQYEVEFDLLPVEDLGCWLSAAKWLIRVIADMYGASVTFLPKLDEGMAGSGMHLHLALFKDGVNVMREGDELSDAALRLIGGLLQHAPALSAFGNTVAASYLRLVPDQEAPTRICWGERNRSSLIRVPLGFDVPGRLDRLFNPDEDGDYPAGIRRPTIELRSPDGSAFVHQLLTAVAICAAEGLAQEGMAVYARGLQVDGNIHQDPETLKRLAALPATAVAAAQALLDQRGFFEERGFPPRLIDIIVHKLEDEDDEGLSEKLRDLPASDRLRASRKLMHKDLHKH